MTDEVSEPHDALTGVVEPVLSYAHDREGRPFEDAHNNVVQALATTQERLRDLRKQRNEINSEIKQLVEDEELLTRMTRVRKPTESPS
jgi:hypothetical protein